MFKVFKASDEAKPSRKRIFDAVQVCGLILAWQKTGDPLLFQQIVLASLELIRNLILHYEFYRERDIEFDELMNEAVLKLARVLRHFNPERGRAFTYFNLAVINGFRDRREYMARRYETVLTVPDKVLTERLSGLIYQPPEVSNEFREHLLGFATAESSGPEEATVRRYIIDSLLKEERIPSVRQVAETTGIRLPMKEIRRLVTYVVGCLRRTFAEDWQDYHKLQRFGVSVALAGVRLRVEVWVIKGW